jgi:hypothetical protein
MDQGEPSREELTTQSERVTAIVNQDVANDYSAVARWQDEPSSGCERFGTRPLNAEFQCPPCRDAANHIRRQTIPVPDCQHGLSRSPDVYSISELNPACTRTCIVNLGR